MVSKDKSRAIYWLQGRWIPFEHPAPAWVLSVQPLLLCNTKRATGGEWGGSRAPSESQHKYGINLHLSAIKRYSLCRLEWDLCAYFASFPCFVLRSDVFTAKLLLLHRISAASISVSAPAGVSDNLHYFLPFFFYTVLPKTLLKDFIISGCKLQVVNDVRTLGTSRFNFR